MRGDVIADTSVVVKCFFDEPDSDKADALLTRFRKGAIRLILLDSIFLEFVNAAWLKVLRNHATEQEAQSRVEALIALTENTEVVATRMLLRETLWECCRNSHAAYDMALLALARQKAIPLLTADVKFYNKIRRHFPAAFLLSDLRI